MAGHGHLTPSVDVENLVTEYFARRNGENWSPIFTEKFVPPPLRRTVSEDPSSSSSAQQRRLLTKARPLQDSNTRNASLPHYGAQGRSLADVKEEQEDSESDKDAVDGGCDTQSPVAEVRTVSEATPSGCVSDGEVFLIRAQSQADGAAGERVAGGGDTLLARRNGNIASLYIPSPSMQLDIALGEDGDRDGASTPCTMIVERLERLGDELDSVALLGAFNHLHMAVDLNYVVFRRVAREAFTPPAARITWQNIAAFLVFSYAAARRWGLLEDIMEWTVRFIVEFFSEWIASQGGWEAILNASIGGEMYPPLAPSNDPSDSQHTSSVTVAIAAAAIFVGVVYIGQR